MNLDGKYKNKKVLITGGGGFIGSNLAIKLVKLGAEVSIMDSKLKPYGFNSFNLSPVIDRIEIDYSDIRDRHSVERNVIGKDIIFNLAAQVGEKTSEENPQLDREINVLGHRNFLEVCRDKNRDARIFFPGSRVQYGRTNEPGATSEDHPMNPLSPYAKSKKEGEEMYLEFNQRDGLETVVFRIAQPFGPRASITNPNYCIVNWFIGRALNRQDLPVYGDGLQSRDYIFIEDLTDAMAIAGVHKNAPGKVYNVGSGKTTPFREMAQKIADLANNGETKLRFVEWPADAKSRETGDFVADISKIKRELRWEPQYTLEDGLRETIRFYQENLPRYS